MSTDPVPALLRRSDPARRPLPVFPWSDAQVEEVADAIDRLSGKATIEQVAREALAAAARVMRLESTPDPQGCPRGYGWRTVRAVTAGYVVTPDGEWVPHEDQRAPDDSPQPEGRECEGCDGHGELIMCVNGADERIPCVHCDGTGKAKGC